MSSSAEALEVDGVRRLAGALVTPELVVLPIRHHSPACAWHVRGVFAARPPSVVLIEGPQSFDPLLPLLADPDAAMPVAVYTHAVDHAGAGAGESRRAAAYYPLCDYSPELVAIREAAARGIPSRFIDLDFAAQRLVEAAEAESAVEDLDGGPGSLQHGRDFADSAHLDLLRRRLGCRDEEELWEHLFESGAAASSIEEHVAGLVAYCQLARLGHAEAGSVAAGRAADVNTVREAEMAWHVRRAVEERAAGDPGAGPVLAVVGGFHAVALPELLATPPARPEIPRGAVEEEVSTLVRYSFERLDRLNGYASGMTSPAWHQLLWERDVRRAKAGLPPSARGREEAALEMLAAVAAELRSRHGVDLPMPAVQAAYEQALRLASLRGRGGPVRDDVLDAVTSCYVKGDVDAEGAVVLAAARRVLGGRVVGRVPRAAGSPPLVRDVLQRARRHRLRVDGDERHQVVLDLYRRAAHRETSRLLHGLSWLGVPFGRCTGGPDFVRGTGIERLQEHWSYAWTVAAETALVEASVLGASLPEAVGRRFGRRVDEAVAAGGMGPEEATGLLVEACRLGLHHRLADVTALVRTAIGAGTSFAAVAAAAGRIALLHGSREPLEAWRVPGLRELLATAYGRAVYLAGELVELDETQDDVAQASVDGLVAVRALLAGRSGADLDEELFRAAVDRIAAGPGHPLLVGACTGLAYGDGRLSGAALAAAAHGRLTAAGPPGRAAAFLRGVLGSAREAAWQEEPLLRAVDAVLRDWSEESFVAALPELRLAFAGLTPRETDRVAEAVARIAGVPGGGVAEVRYDVTEAQVQANLALTAAVRAALAGDGLAHWVAGGGA